VFTQVNKPGPLASPQAHNHKAFIIRLLNVTAIPPVDAGVLTSIFGLSLVPRSGNEVGSHSGESG